jgi:hypothetical protein
MDKGKQWCDQLQQGGDTAAGAALDLISNFSQGTLAEKLA